MHASRWLVPLRRWALVLVLALTASATAQDNVLRIPLQTQPVSFNPVLARELAAVTVNWALFAPLTMSNPETYQIEPYLARSWESNDDATQWTFDLHPDAVWHDGQPLTADDVVFTFERILDPNENAPARSDVVGFLESVESLDAHTVRFHLSSPNALFPATLSVGGMEPLPRHLFEGFARLEDAGDLNTRTPIGSGAFRMREAVSGSYFDLEAFPDFFLGAPQLDGILFKIVPDPNARLAQLLAGDLDWVSVTPNNLARLQGNSRIATVSVPNTYYEIVDWNNSDLFPFFEDRRVRLALIHGLDRDRILETVGLGMGYVSDTFVPAAMSAWMSIPDNPSYGYDPELAARLLDEAGWSDTDGDGVRDRDGVPFSFYLLVDRGNAVHEQVGLVVQQAFADLGIEVEYLLVDRTGRWLDETRARTFPTRMTNKTVPHPVWFLRYFTLDGNLNNGLYRREAVDDLLRQVLRTTDEQARDDLFLQVQQLLYEDPPFLIIFHLQELIAYNAQLRGLPSGEIKLSMPLAYQVSFSD